MRTAIRENLTERYWPVRQRGKRSRCCWIRLLSSRKEAASTQIPAR